MTAPLAGFWLEESRDPYGVWTPYLVRMFRQDHRPPAFGRPIGGGLYTAPTLLFGDRMPPAREARMGYTLTAGLSEQNGVGAMPTEALADELGPVVRGIHTSQRSKEDAYGRLRTLIENGGIVLPDHEALRRQLAGLSAEPTPGGGIRIEASNPAIHDDLTDALSLAVAALPEDWTPGHPSDFHDDVELIETPGGLVVPKYPRPRKDALRRRGAYGWSE